MTANELQKGCYLNDFPCNYTVIDIETTGLSSSRNEIIEISALKVRNDEIISKFSSLIKPEKPIGTFITKLTGITNAMTENAPNITKVLPEFLEFISDDCILGHNVHFDINFIYANLMRHFNTGLPNDYTDTLRLARKYCEFKSNSLENLSRQFNISSKGHHRAMNDCIMTFEIYKKIKNLYLNNAESQNDLKI